MLKYIYVRINSYMMSCNYVLSFVRLFIFVGNNYYIDYIILLFIIILFISIRLFIYYILYYI